MCEQSDAMRAVREAAACLSAACRARTDPAILGLVALYDQVAAEPVPDELLRVLRRLDGSEPSGH